MIKKLPIEYNSKIQLGAVHDEALTTLQLDQLFEDFRIITIGQQNWLNEVPINAQVSFIPHTAGTDDNVPKYLRSKKFVEMVSAEPKRKYVLYSPLDPPYKVNPLTYLMNSP